MDQPYEGCADSSPTPSLYLVAMATPPLLAGAHGSKALARPHPGLWSGTLSLRLIGRFTSPLIGRDPERRCRARGA